MKKLILFLFILIPVFAMAGQVRDIPNNKEIVFGDPTNHTYELVSIKYSQDSNNFAEIIFYVISSSGKRLNKHRIRIQNALDNPNSIAENCTGEGEPWPLCTGEGTCANNCDESTSDFTDFVQGYISTVLTRTDAAVGAFINEHYPTQDRP